jgi:hypothetical protein
MKNDFVSSGRAVSDMKAHLVLTTKYRRKAITFIGKMFCGMSRTLSHHVAGSLSRYCANTLKIKTRLFSGMRNLLVSSISPDQCRRHWSGERRQLARILPDAHPIG